MKTTLRIPTKDQYAFIEVETDQNNTPAEIKSIYDGLISAFQDPDGVSNQDFCLYLQAIIDSDLNKWGDVESYNMLNDSQKKVAQSLKRLAKRIQANNSIK